MTALPRIWLWLLALTAATTTLAVFPGRSATAALLGLAFLKARAILGGFLHLDHAPGWLTAVSVPLALWLGLIGLLAVL